LKIGVTLLMLTLNSALLTACPIQAGAVEIDTISPQINSAEESLSPLFADITIQVDTVVVRIPVPGTYAKPRNPQKQIELYPGPLYLRNEHSNFWRKAGRAELFIGGVEVIGMVCLVAMPKDVTKWEEDWLQSITRNWKRTFTNPPVMDEDDAWLNYVAHPLVGSWYYNSVRSQNARWWESFLWSLAQSTFWEYVIEGMAEQPSIQDLWVTPVMGAALGEPIHQATMAMRKNGYTTFEKITVTILNPMFVFNNGYRTPLSFRKKDLVKF
jgi:hypothetical protein